MSFLSSLAVTGKHTDCLHIHLASTACTRPNGKALVCIIPAVVCVLRFHACLTLSECELHLSKTESAGLELDAALAPVLETLLSEGLQLLGSQQEASSEAPHAKPGQAPGCGELLAAGPSTSTSR